MIQGQLKKSIGGTIMIASVATAISAAAYYPLTRPQGETLESYISNEQVDCEERLIHYKTPLTQAQHFNQFLIVGTTSLFVGFPIGLYLFATGESQKRTYEKAMEREKKKHSVETIADKSYNIHDLRSNTRTLDAGTFGPLKLYVP